MLRKQEILMTHCHLASQLLFKVTRIHTNVVSFHILFFKDMYGQNIESKTEGIERIIHSKEGIPQHFYILVYMHHQFLWLLMCYVRIGMDWEVKLTVVNLTVQSAPQDGCSFLIWLLTWLWSYCTWATTATITITAELAASHFNIVINWVTSHSYKANSSILLFRYKRKAQITYPCLVLYLPSGRAKIKT